MPKSKTATDVADEPGSKHQTALKPVPKGAVYGFDFPFDGQAEHPHPGIVISSKVGKRGGVDKIGIIALAITHSEQETSWRNLTAVSVPDEEKQRMGLDAQKQWVCLFEQVTVFFPDSIKLIKSAGDSYLGQASDTFTKKVTEAWNEYRRG